MQNVFAAHSWHSRSHTRRALEEAHTSRCGFSLLTMSSMMGHSSAIQFRRANFTHRATTRQRSEPQRSSVRVSVHLVCARRNKCFAVDPCGCDGCVNERKMIKRDPAYGSFLSHCFWACLNDKNCKLVLFNPKASAFGACYLYNHGQVQCAHARTRARQCVNA